MRYSVTGAFCPRSAHLAVEPAPRLGALADGFAAHDDAGAVVAARAPLRALLRRVRFPAQIDLAAPPPVQLGALALGLLRPHSADTPVLAVAPVLFALVAGIPRQTAALHPQRGGHGGAVLPADGILAVAPLESHRALAALLQIVPDAHSAVLARQLGAVLAPRPREP